MNFLNLLMESKSFCFSGEKITERKIGRLSMLIDR